MISFRIAKKINRQKGEELTLSTLRGTEQKASLSLISKDNRVIKDSVAEFRQDTGIDVFCNIRGKSVQIYAQGQGEPVAGESGQQPDGSATEKLLLFMQTLTFSNEDIKDVLDFCTKLLNGFLGELKITSLELDKDSFIMGIESCDEMEAVLSRLSQDLTTYNLGIIKDKELSKTEVDF